MKRQWEVGGGKCFNVPCQAYAEKPKMSRKEDHSDLIL